MNQFLDWMSVSVVVSQDGMVVRLDGMALSMDGVGDETTLNSEAPWLQGRAAIGENQSISRRVQSLL